MHRIAFGLIVLCFGCRGHAAEPCAKTIAGLRALVSDEAFPLRWLETSMDDGKPLVLSIDERLGALHLEFVKTGEGLWAESAGSVCLTDGHLEARFGHKQIRFGPGSGWATRIALAPGGKFTVIPQADGRLWVSTTGWSATFSALR